MYQKAVRLVAFLAVIAAPSAWADASFHYKLGYDTGGDTLVTVVFAGGDTETIKANRGFFFGAGVSLLNDTKDFETEISLSYKFDDITASNGDVSWDRLPIEVLGFYRFPSVRVGGGLTYHLNPKLDGSGAAAGVSADFKNALGFVLQVDYRIADNVNVGLRYTDLEYELEGAGGITAKSNGVGIVLSGRL